MKKLLLIFVIVVIIIPVAYILFPKKDLRVNSNVTFTNITDSSSYAEYAFDSGDDLDLGFTKRAYNQLTRLQTLLDAGSETMADNVMASTRLTEQEIGQGIIERRLWDNDRYELTQEPAEGIYGNYRLLINGELLFEEQMDFGADGPILDWRMIDGKPAFTLRVACAAEEKTCDHDIWYDGALVSETFNVVNPRYLFSYNGKVGFVAMRDGADAIYYDGGFITPNFDTIWTHNCCSYTEILPTVYENGTLLFYARRGGVNYLAEAQLD